MAMNRNLPTLTDLADIDPVEIARFSAEELFILQTVLTAEQDRLKKAAARLNAGIEKRYADDVAAERKTKPFGIVHIDDEEFDVAVDQTKRVEWNSDALGNLIVNGALTAEQADHFIRYKYDVLESRYSGAEPKVKALLDKARTVKPGTAKYTITRKGDGK